MCSCEDRPCCGCEDQLIAEEICAGCREPFEFCICGSDFVDDRDEEDYADDWEDEEDFDDEPREEMDGDFDTAMRDAGFGMDEDYYHGNDICDGDY